MKRILIILVLLACQAHAEVYKSVNANGEVVYSDTPTQGAERLKMPALPTYTPPPLAAPGFTPVQAAETNDVYKSFAFVSPVNE